jgi:hypothetical protein
MLATLYARARTYSAPWLTVASILLLGTLLHATNGAFRPWAVPALLATALLWWLLVVGSPAVTPDSWALHALALLVLVAEAAIVAGNPHIFYVQAPLRALVLKRTLTAFALVVAALGVWSLLRPHQQRLRTRWFWAAAAFLFAARISVLAISPRPHIDVFTSGTLGAEYLWNGLNPYAQKYPDLYGGLYRYDPVFFYPPTYLVLAAFGYVMGDIRWANIAAEAITVGAALSFARDHATPHMARSLWLLWLCFPVYLFMIEQAWVDPIVLAPVAWGMRALSRRQYAWAGVAFGLSLGVKQSMVLMNALCLAWVFRTAGLRAALGFGAWAGLATAAAYVPFLIWDRHALIQSLVTTILETAHRMDALTVSAWFHYLGVADVRVWLTRFASAFSLGAVVWLALRARRLSDLTSVVTLTYFVVFLCGYQAFCNYYWFTGGLLALDMLVRIPARAPEREPAPATISGAPRPSVSR